MELLPAERNTRIEQRRTTLSERLIQSHDGVVIFVDQERASSVLPILPFAPLMQRLHKQASLRSAAAQFGG